MSPARSETWVLPASVRRLVVLGDPHGDLVALELILEREAGAETAFVSVGDNVGYADGRTSSYFCELLVEQGIRSVLGNHEDGCREDGRLQISPAGLPRQLTPEALEWTRSLPHRLRIESERLGDLSVGVVHTLPDWAYVDAKNVERLAQIEGTALTFCGHTHKAAIYTLPASGRQRVARFDPLAPEPLVHSLGAGARTVVDAGSLARPVRPRGRACPQRATYATFDLDERQLRLCSVNKGPRLKQLMKEWMAS